MKFQRLLKQIQKFSKDLSFGKCLVENEKIINYCPTYGKDNAILTYTYDRVLAERLQNIAKLLGYKVFTTETKVPLMGICIEVVAY